MAIDTICLRSPYLSEREIMSIEKVCCTLKQTIDLSTGMIQFQITTGMLEGSFDSRISFRIERTEWKCLRGVTYKVDCMPYLILEASVHKIMLGHNVFGGPLDFRLSAKWLIDLVGNAVGLCLPDSDFWYVRRVDVAEVYELDSFEQCREWFRGLNVADFPRRNVDRYGLSGLYAKGRSTTVKFYHKGPEFMKHDRKRLKNILSIEELELLQQRANVIIRVEVEIKHKKLQYDFGNQDVQVKDITLEYLNKVHDTEVKRMLQECAKEINIVRNSRAVESRLLSIYKPALAGTLIGTWHRLAAHGEKAVKETMKQSTFYYQRKKLKDAGIAWTNTDIMLKKFSLVPNDFVPERKNERRIEIEAEQVKNHLSVYRLAV